MVFSGDDPFYLVRGSDPDQYDNITHFLRYAGTGEGRDALPEIQVTYLLLGNSTIIFTLWQFEKKISYSLNSKGLNGNT